MLQSRWNGTNRSKSFSTFTNNSHHGSPLLFDNLSIPVYVDPKMVNDKSSSKSFPNFSYCYNYGCSLLQNGIIFSTICLILNTANANGFDPLIQLPTNGLYGNVSAYPKIVLLNINDFGAKGDGFTDDTEVLRDVWKIACSLPSQSKIIMPQENSYLIRPIDFSGPCKSNVTLRISGTIMAPGYPEAWSGLDVHKWLYFHGVENLKMEGGGIIDGMGAKWWAQSCKMNASNPCTHAPTAVTFHKCNNLKVRNVTLRNSQQMHMAFTSCDRVAASGLFVIAPAYSPNTDGIHISASRSIVLKNIVISTGDDCISIVSTSTKIHITNIFCRSGHGISIGSLGKNNSSAAVQDIIVNGAILFDTQNGLRIKTWQGGRGFARKITFENVWMQNVSNPILIDQYYCDSTVPCANQTSAVSIDSITFRGIKGTSATEEAIVFNCSDISPCKRLYLENIQLRTVSGEAAKSFCWEAYGISRGIIYPTSCVSSDDIIIENLAF